MPDLLLELFSEEIPARMQRQAAEDLKRLVTGALVDADVLYEGAQSFATPRRLALHIVGLPEAQPHRHEERKGPRVGAPDAAIQGFLKSAGLARIEDATIVSDGKKGEIYVALIDKPGRATRELLAEIIPKTIRDFPWPKSMHWGDYEAPKAGLGAYGGPGGFGVAGSYGSIGRNVLKWVRPLHSILCTMSDEYKGTEIVPFAIDNIIAGDSTRGHRFLAPGAIHVRRYEDYVDALFKAKVVLDADRRKQMILADAKSLAFAQGLELVEDEGLLEEVAGLVEWPVVLMGEFEAEFLEIPPEVIRATIRANQKCFVLRDGAGKLANKFILVSNLVASDGGAAIAAGNGRVVRARLSDARHFWRTDLAPLPDYRDKAENPLDQRLEKLKALAIVFHEKLGTQGDRVERIAALARELAPKVGADPALAERAARLAKADLVTEMVGEFPELQGLMGRYYATAQGEDTAVATALEEHYKPQGPNDRIPNAPVSIAVALADKIDTLVGFWAINEKPTGSKDPYALRRAALGIIRIALEADVRLNLIDLFRYIIQRELKTVGTVENNDGQIHHVYETRFANFVIERVTYRPPVGPIPADATAAEELEARTFHSKRISSDLLAFFAERLKVYLRDKGARHDLIDAVFALAGQDDLLMIVRRVEALGRFLETDDGRNLLAGYRRAANILKAEEKKAGEGAFAGSYDTTALVLVEEKSLAEALAKASAEARVHIEAEDFEGAMRALAILRAPVDAFFVAVTVNADDPALRLNRLRLLGALRGAVHTVADFSKIAG